MKLVISILSIAYISLCTTLGVSALHWLIKEEIVSSIVGGEFSRLDVVSLERLSKLRNLLGLSQLDLTHYKAGLKVLTKKDELVENVKMFPFIEMQQIEIELNKAKEKIEKQSKINSLRLIRQMLASFLGVSNEEGLEIIYEEGVLKGLPTLLVLKEDIPNLRALRDTLDQIGSRAAPVWGYAQKELLNELERLRLETEKTLKTLKIPEPELPERVIDRIRAQVRSYLIEKTDEIQVNFF